MKEDLRAERVLGDCLGLNTEQEDRVQLCLGIRRGLVPGSPWIPRSKDAQGLI